MENQIPETGIGGDAAPDEQRPVGHLRCCGLEIEGLWIVDVKPVTPHARPFSHHLHLGHERGAGILVSCDPAVAGDQDPGIVALLQHRAAQPKVAGSQARHRPFELLAGMGRPPFWRQLARRPGLGDAEQTLGRQGIGGERCRGADGGIDRTTGSDLFEPGRGGEAGPMVVPDPDGDPGLLDLEDPQRMARGDRGLARHRRLGEDLPAGGAGGLEPGAGGSGGGVEAIEMIGASRSQDLQAAHQQARRLGPGRQGHAVLDAPAEPPVRGRVVTDPWVDVGEAFEHVAGELARRQGPTSAAVPHLPPRVRP